jgi:hypothetical protein
LSRGDAIGSLGLDVADFWEWAFGALGVNSTRGVFAEYLVGVLLAAARDQRLQWAPHDLTYRGCRIEVKSAAYLQDWKQVRPSTISFSVAPTYPEAEIAAAPRVREHRSELYVLCLEVEKDRHRFDPLQLSQWLFYVVPTDLIRREAGLTIGVGWLERHGIQPHGASTLRDVVDRMIGSMAAGSLAAPGGGG